jgi:hypothetical protein
VYAIKRACVYAIKTVFFLWVARFESQ